VAEPLLSSNALERRPAKGAEGVMLLLPGAQESDRIADQISCITCA
jgi:hypothetical protein